MIALPEWAGTTLLLQFGLVEKTMLAGAGVCLLLLFLIIRSTFTAPVSRSTLSRLQNYIDREENLSPLERLIEHEEQQQLAAGRKRRKGDLLPTVSKWIADSPIRFLNSLSADLNRIGSNWRASEICYAAVVGAVLTFFVVGVLMKRPGTGFMLGIGAGMVPFMLVKRASRRWTARFETQLADTLLLMANATSAGYGFQQAMEMVAREGQPPMSDEFTKMSQEVQLGVPISEALNHMSERVQNSDFTLAVTAIQISMEVGGALSEILRSISETIRERVRIRGEISILTAQGKITGLMLSCLPVGMFFLLNMVGGTDEATGEKYASPLFNGKVYPFGPKMVAYGVFSQIVGYMIINRIVNIEV